MSDVVFGLICFFRREGFWGCILRYGFSSKVESYVHFTKEDFLNDVEVEKALDLIENNGAELCLDPLEEEDFKDKIPPNATVLEEEEVLDLIDALHLIDKKKK